MSILAKLFTGGASSLVSAVGDIVDDVVTTKEEKERIKLRFQQILNEREIEADKNYRAELQSRAEIIKAEMAQGDSYTKRARPSVIYAGLGFIFLVHVFLPSYAFFAERPTPDLTLPTEFWAAWATVVSVYAAGRSAEKRGAKDKITKMITG